MEEGLQKRYHISPLLRIVLAAVILIPLVLLGFVAGMLVQQNNSQNIANNTIVQNSSNDDTEDIVSEEEDDVEVEEETEGNVVTYTDSEISNFSFVYDSDIWIETTEDLKFCGGQGCGEPRGRLVTLTHKNYADDPDRVSLTFSLSIDPVNESEVNNEICIDDEYIDQLDSNWYSAQNPNHADQDAAQGIWSLYYYPAESVEDNCVKGSLNIFVQPKSDARYEGQQVYLYAGLANYVDESMNSVADDIIKSIKFY